MAEGSNSPGQLGPADSVLQNVTLWWPDKGGWTGGLLTILVKPPQGDLFKTARELSEREFSKDQASGDFNTAS